MLLVKPQKALWMERFFDFLLDFLAIYWYWHLLINSFLDFFHSSLIMNTAVLMSFSRRSAITFFSVIMSIGLFFFFEWAILSYFFVCLAIFFGVENWTFVFNIVIPLKIRFSPCRRVSCVLLLFLIVLILNPAATSLHLCSFYSFSSSTVSILVNSKPHSPSFSSQK